MNMQSRSHCFLIGMLTLVALVAKPSPGQRLPVDPPELTGDAKQDLRNVTNLRFGVAPRVLPAVPPDDCFKYSKYLQLAEPQVAFLRFLYSHYKDAYSATLRNNVENLARL